MNKSILSVGLVAVLIALTGCALLVNVNTREARKYEKNPSIANYDGKVSVPGLAGKAEIVRDQSGVPHVFADDAHDLYFATGYVQAQDRLWEMVLLRAVAEGRTAELMGDLGVPGVSMVGMPISTVNLDKRQQTFGMKYIGEAGAALMKQKDPKLYGYIQAYCDGVNFYIDSLADDKLPVEFRMLGIRPGHWEPAHVASFGRFVGSLLCSNMPVELARHAAIKKYGPDRGWRLFPLHFNAGPVIVPTEILGNRLDSPRDIPPGGRPSDEELGGYAALPADAALKMQSAELAFSRALRLTDDMGSNNWIAGGKVTESGAAMLANDPHLQHLEPSLFYIIHLKGAGYDCMGVTFPGNPFIVLGHTRKLAWGATTTRADVQDLFVEKTDPQRPGGYIYKGQWLPFTRREEIIKVRTGKIMSEKKYTVLQTVHGPVINDFAEGHLDGDPPTAMRWTGWDFSRNLAVFQALAGSGSAAEFMTKMDSVTGYDILSTAASVERLMRAENLEDFQAAMAVLDVPNQNWVGADDAGHIIYLPGGLVPVRGKGIGALPVPGESGEFDWTGFVPLMELPHAIDPERGWMATANNQVVDARYYPHIFSTHHGEPWRAIRIEELLKEKIPLSMDDMVAIQNDVMVARARWMMPIIEKALEGKTNTDDGAQRALAELRGWDYLATVDSTAPLVFFEFLKALFNASFEDEVDKEDFKSLRVEGYPEMLLDVEMSRGDSDMFDDKRTKEAEDLGDMAVKALAEAWKKVEKKWGADPAGRPWGDIHVIKFYHPLGFGKGKGLSVGPFPYAGATQTVRNASVAGFGKWPYKTIGGACLRHIIDMSDVDNALIMIDGSESGQWLSPYYDNLHPMFVKGEYLKADKNRERIESGAAHTLVLEK